LKTGPGAYDALQQRTLDGEIVWHYTSWQSAEGILRSNELWATDYRFLNDLSECLHALEIARGRFDVPFDYLNYRIDEILAEREKLEPAYVVSLSRAFDSLGQWRAYAQGSAGIALGFSKPALERLGALYGLQVLTCVYAEADKQEMFRDQHTRWTQFYEDGIRRAAAAQTDMQRHIIERPLRDVGGAAFQEFMHTLALRFKHPSFASEDEVRLASGFVGFSGEMGHCPWYPMPFGRRKRDATDITYYRMPLTSNPAQTLASVTQMTVEDIPHPLAGVLVGPTAGPEGAGRAKQLLSRQRPELEANVVIVSSRVPLRF